MKDKSFFNDVENRRELMRKLNMINGVSILEDQLSKRPSIPLSVLASSPSQLEKFLSALTWAVQEYMSA